VAKRVSKPSDEKERPSGVELGAVLRGAGLRRTAPRVAVLRYLELATAPLTHAEIADAVGAAFDRVTVYRNLHDLVEAKLVTRKDLGDHVWRYELRRATDAHSGEHPHFLCVDCGEVSCLPGDVVKLVSSRNVPRAVGKKAVEVQIKGRCDACWT